MRALSVVSLVLFTLSGCGKLAEKEAEREQAKAAEAKKWAATDDAKAKAIAELTSGSTVSSASFQGTDSVTLVTADDGSSRSGLAEWGCGVLRDHEAVNSKSIVVFVKDGGGKVLGDATCKHHSLPY